MHDRILIDTGPLVALFHTGDNFHRSIRDFLGKNQYRFISTLAVFTEASHLMSVNVNAQQDFYEWAVYHGVIICDINQHDLPRIAEFTKKYSDLPMDFADATLVIAAEKTGIRKIISLDKDFDIYRLPGREHIHNVFKVTDE